METARCAASWKGVTQSDTYGTSRNSRHRMRNGKHQRSQNVALSECGGKVVVDSVTESNNCATSWKGVTDINMCLASRKRRHGKHQETVRRAASWKATSVERHGKAVAECVTESTTQAASRKKASWKASWKV